MTVVRVGQNIWNSTRLKRNLRAKYIGQSFNIVHGTGSMTTVHFDDFWKHIIAPLMDSPIKRSILSSYVRSSRLCSDEEADIVIAESITKEVQATQGDVVPRLQYPFFYSREDCLRHSIHPDLPFRPIVSLDIRTHFHNLRRFFSNRLLYPQCGTKLVGLQSSENLEARLYPSSLDYGRPNRKYSTADLEAYYADTGMYVDGPCEVRTAWLFNTGKPRIYYAIGASCYFVARYVHEIFDRIQRMIRCCNPNTRYTFVHFPYINFDEEIFMIYDYASFTSKLGDFPRFCEELAIFMDVDVWLFDTHYGVKKESLKHLLLEYNRVANINGEFDVIQLPGTKGARVILNHKVAGMLGVYGNIVGSTALHGLVGYISTGDVNRINTIGDDAGGLWSRWDMTVEHIREAIRCIGEIADEKFEIWEEDQNVNELFDGWHYTKRPLSVEDGIIVQKWMPDFPIVGLAADKFPKHITKTMDFHERRKAFVKQTCRFLTSCSNHSLSDEDVGLVTDILRSCYTKLHLPYKGSLPNRYAKPNDIAYPMEFLCVPPLSEESIREGWWTILKRDADRSGLLSLPVVEAPDQIPDVLDIGVTFVAKADKGLTLLQKIGVVRMEALYEDRLISDESLDILDNVMSGKIPRLYRYVGLVDYPPWTTFCIWRETQ